MTLDELLEAIAAFLAGDATKAKELAKAMRNHATAKLLATELIGIGAGKKKGETDAEITRLQTELAAMTTERDDALTEIEDLKKKTPDVASIEERLNQRHQKTIAAKDTALAEKDRTLKGALVKSVREKLISVLVTDHQVDPDYAREVLAPKYANRFTADDTGVVSVLELGSTDPIDGDDEDAQVANLAAAIAKTVPARYVISHADSGSGLRNSNGTSHRRAPVDVQAETRRNPMYRF